MCFVPRQQKGLKNLHLCCLSVKIGNYLWFLYLSVNHCSEVTELNAFILSVVVSTEEFIFHEFKRNLLDLDYPKGHWVKDSQHTYRLNSKVHLWLIPFLAKMRMGNPIISQNLGIMVKQETNCPYILILKKKKKKRAKTKWGHLEKGITPVLFYYSRK